MKYVMLNILVKTPHINIPNTIILDCTPIILPVLGFNFIFKATALKKIKTI
jgi:hypothetical protein